MLQHVYCFQFYFLWKKSYIRSYIRKTERGWGQIVQLGLLSHHLITLGQTTLKGNITLNLLPPYNLEVDADT